MDEHAQAGTARGRGPLRDAALGVALSWGAGTVQVLAAQGVGLLLGRRERADIAPRLVQRAAERLGAGCWRRASTSAMPRAGARPTPWRNGHARCGNARRG